VTLPKGWSETEPRSNRPGTFRFTIRSSKRFRVGTLRTVQLEGIKGVKLIAGKLRPGDPEISRHKGPDVMVPQTVIFLKPEWADFRRALAWQESHFTAIDNPPKRRRRAAAKGNPPPIERSRAAASLAIEKLVHIETEISSLFVQALELQSRGERMPDWMADRIRGAQLEKKAALEDVKQAIGRHGATIGEFHVPKNPRGRHAPRPNPSRKTGGRAAAVKLYEEFHGVAPKGFTTRHVPDLSQLVHLGRALRVDYEAARPRGPRGTPYRHAFSAGSELFTDRTGRALVILGNIKVSRAPRGRFGYIRACAGE